MSKKQTYLFILAMGLILIFIGQFMHISYINKVTHNTWVWMQSPYIFAPAAVCAFVFMNNGKYWLINLAVAIIASLAIQFLVLKGGWSLYIILIRAFAFIVVVYLMNLVKVILDK